MPQIHDREQIRRRLHQDPVWAAYAIGDLGPEYFPYCSWHVSGDAIALVFRRYELPVLWAAGEGPDLERVLDEAAVEPRLDLQVTPEALSMLERRYTCTSLRTMSRMAVCRREFAGAAHDGAERLSAASLTAVQRLYADGDADGTSPNYFYPAMLNEGVFFGVWDAGELVSAAGTHVVALEEKVAAVGNVYTRRDRRGRGYGGATTAAVVSALFDMGVEVAALNVNVSNPGAARVYERLGFREYHQFREGLAERL